MLSFGYRIAFTRKSISFGQLCRPILCTRGTASPRSASFTRFFSSTTFVDDEGNICSEQNTPLYIISQIHSNGSIQTKTLQAAEVLRGSSIQARDLYSLALTRPCQKARRRGRIHHRRPMSAILPRGNQILLSFGSIRAVVGAESAMLFDAQLATVTQFSEEISGLFSSSKARYAQGSQEEEEPFELRFIEEVLKWTCDAYSRRITLYEPIVDSMLNQVSNEVFSDAGVHRLVPVKTSLQEFEMRVQQALECLTELLDNDDDMLGLLLSEQIAAKERGKSVGHERHEGVELLLEDYSRQLSNILFETRYLLQRLQSKQEFVALALDGYRNRVIRLNAYMSMFGLGLGVGTAAAGFFGMNVITGYETSTLAFPYVIASSTLGGALIIFTCSSYIRGNAMKQRAIARLKQNETITGALSDMDALDYTLQKINTGGVSMSREEFKKTLRDARQSKTVTEEEVDLLFTSLDMTGDGLLDRDDMKRNEELQE